MTLKLGTRRSDLALTQSGWVARQLGPDVELVGVVTEGDRLVDVPLRSGSLGKGFFTEALETGLLEGTLDLAVHSLKDLPVVDRAGLTIGATPLRESPADLLIVRHEAVDESADGLPVKKGATIGAASERRQALVRAVRPDVAPQFLRGNVPTRVQRLADGKFDAILLAEAGLRRLGTDLSAFAVYRLDPMDWPSAAGQGSLAVQCRAGDERVLSRLRTIHHAPTYDAVVAERQWLSVMGGGCTVPFGAVILDGRWAAGLEKDGKFRVRRGTNPADGPDAVRAMLAGDEGEGWTGRIWERA